MNAAKKAIKKVRAALVSKKFEKPLNMFKCGYCNLCEMFEKHTRSD